MVTRKKKTWCERRDGTRPHVVKPCPKDVAGMKAGQLMLIPSGELIDKAIRKIPKGKTLDMQSFRARLAKQAKAEVTCPVTTGIIMRMVAEAAHETHEAGTPIAQVTPFWRVLDEDAPTIKKVTFDAAPYMQQRALELD